MGFSDEDGLRARKDFPALARTDAGKTLAFFDGPAGTQVPNQVMQAINDVYLNFNVNTGGDFVTSREVGEAMWRTREKVAQFFNAADPSSISFGQNMTTLAYSLSHAFARLWGEGDEVVVSALDHEANRGPWLQLEERGVRIREIGIDGQGRYRPDDIEEMITERTRLVTVCAASNALGTVNDLSPIRARTREVGAWMLVDAVHYAPHLPIDVAGLDPDFLLCSAYKFYGPHVGFLYARSGLLDSLPTDRLRTQKQSAPYRIETGTLNHAAIVGSGAAIDYIASWGEGDGYRERLVSAMTGIAALEHELARQYYDAVISLPGVTAHGPDFSAATRTPTVSISIATCPADKATAKLARRGLCLWNGHFYAIRPTELLGLLEHGGLIRMGVSMYNTPDEIDRLIEGIRALTSA